MLWVLLLGVTVALIVPLLQPIFRSQAKPNFRGELIPTGLGLSFVLPSVLVIVANYKNSEFAFLFALTLLFFALLGNVDDNLGHASKKGFKGHLGHKELSSGTLKAVGGLGISLIVASILTTGWLNVLIDGMIIALSANFLNLLDLRPGRSGKVFLILSFILFLFSRQQLFPLLLLLGAVVGYLPWDLRGIVMMGDTGSNSLGAALGLAAVIVLPRYMKLLVLLILVVLNLLSEKISFSRLIESNRFLRFLDDLGR